MKWITALGLSLLALPAIAQTRYDHDGKWVYETIKESRDEARQRERREARREARFYREGERHREREYSQHHEPHRYYWIEHSRRYAHRDREDYGTRVYGMITRGPQFIERNVTSNVDCFPALEDQGSAHTSENAAQADAEISWSQKVSGQYGAIFGDFRNAADRTKTCWRASYEASFVSRNAEALAQHFGGKGYKTVCKVHAKPCRARPVPIEMSREEQRTGNSEPPETRQEPSRR